MSIVGGDKVYLGDGVYALYDGFGICLTTENGLETTNRIYLEPAVLESFRGFCDRLVEELVPIATGLSRLVKGDEEPE